MYLFFNCLRSVYLLLQIRFYGTQINPFSCLPVLYPLLVQLCCTASARPTVQPTLPGRHPLHQRIG